MKTRRPWLAHATGLVAAALLWAVAAFFWGDAYTWWVGPLILTWPTYKWTKNLMLLGMPEAKPGPCEYVPYDAYHPNTTGYFNKPDRD